MIRLRKVLIIALSVIFAIAWLIWIILVFLNNRVNRIFFEDLPSSNVAGMDRTEIWDSKVLDGNTYTLVYVWTTFPDFMQRVDLYRYVGGIKNIERKDFKRENLILSETIEDYYQGSDSWKGYSARTGKSGQIDFVNKRIIIKFETGKNQIIKVKEF